jgi:protein SCO1/2
MLALALVASGLSPASAHSVKDLDRLLGQRERYYQRLEKDMPSFTLNDAQGRPVSPSDFRGKVVVLHFIYAACPDICPLHADRIAEIQSMINRTPMKDAVQFISVTTDPTTDTPEVMRNYGQNHSLDPANWRFLTIRQEQPEDTTRKLAEQFGHKFIKDESGYQIHSIVTHVIDRDGRWRGNFHGLKFNPTSLVVFVNALVNNEHKPHPHPEATVWDRIKRLFEP